jgi:riboflavin kinase/FMN adenylyltransferase
VAERSVAAVAGVEGLEAQHGPLFVVIGVFDGIHRGHQYLLERLVAEARGRGAKPAVITFDSHPDEILVGAAPPLLLDQGERLRLLGEAGVDIVVVQHFDEALRRTEYDDFVHRITSRTSLAGILMTPDAAFGHERRGTPETVAAVGASDGFEVVVIPPFTIDGRSVRSSDIRAAIAAGDLGTAEELLGRPYAVTGEASEIGVSRVAMAFHMPVALPPAGEREVTIEWPDGRQPWPAVAIIGDDGSVTLATIPFDGNARIVFH